ncbi:MAG: geranylgeranylglyceryl/heptaprenylglyceryl phosphate synthase [Desulfurococcaceae archaeon]|nr:geranylgeranylglyceryl/heptaprenylglyceryl phosphate synthase [Desulfurococcaceae archaeon]
MGKVHEYIVSKIERGEKLHFTLVDPDRANPSDLEKVSKLLVDAGTDAFMIGGSLAVTPEEATLVARILREHGLPVIVFPGNLNCLTPQADAVLFMILMNSLEPYYLIQAHVQAAPIIAKYRLEPLPTAYLVIGLDTAVAHVGRVHPIPRDKPEIVVAYALAAEMLGLKYIYLEAGSGAKEPLSPVLPQFVKKYTRLVTIVGGGIRSPEVARELAKHGADIVVTGTILEESVDLASTIIRAIKEI